MTDQPLSSIMAIDIGTSACKVSILAFSGLALASQSRRYTTHYSKGGVAEQDPEDWWRAVCQAVQALLADLDLPRFQVEVIALTGQMSALVGVDASGAPTFPAAIWEDQRAATVVDSIATMIDRDDYYKITGNPLSAVYPYAKLKWYLDHEPELIARTSLFIEPKDYIAHKLTGVFATDFSDASCSGIFDITSRQWASSLLALISLDKAKLPEILYSTAIVGKISKQASAASGLQDGIPVVMGGGDGPITAIAANAIHVGSHYASFGSSAWIADMRSVPDLDNGNRLLNFCHVLPDLYTVTGSIQNSGNCIEWALKTLLHVDLSRHTVTDFLSDHGNELLSCGVGSNGLTFLPYLLGDRTPFWSAALSGALLGLRSYHSQTDILHAILEGVAVHFRLVRDLVVPLENRTFPMLAVGGGIAGTVFPQILSDVLETSITRTGVTASSTAHGAALLAGVAIGVWQDVQQGLQAFGVQQGVTTFSPRYNDDRYASLSERLKYLTEEVDRMLSVAEA